MTTRVGVGIGERGRRRPGECAEVGAPRRVEHERHLGESPRPAAARLGAELARDHAADDRVLALGLDLVGDDESALTRREELDRVDLHGFRIEEPTRHLGELGERGRALDQRGIGGRKPRRRRRGGPVEEPAPARESLGRRGSLRRVEGQRLGDEADRARGIALDPRELLGRPEGGELGLEPPLGDLAPRDLEHPGRIVDDERAEGRAAEAALEEDPEGA